MAKQINQRNEKDLVSLTFLMPLLMALLGYLQFRNWFIHALPQGLSDIPAFYRMRFSDGLHHWPYESYVPMGKTNPLNPIEYPALIGLIVWTLSFFVKVSENSALDYFLVNTIFITILFTISSLLIQKISGKRYAKFYYLSPAVVLSLYLNWDIWVVAPMIAALYAFEKRKMTLSAVLLAIAISTKFFPIILLVPILIFLYRSKEKKAAFQYTLVTAGSWLAVNIPFVLANFRGWFYFYKFSFKRDIGEGSIFTIFDKFGMNFSGKNFWYYLLNFALYSAFICFLIFRKNVVPVSLGAFLAIFVFTIFGKQYSMQYVLWLTPVALFAISGLSKINQKFMLRLYVTWQFTELLFNTAYFNNLWWSLSDKQTGIPNEEYAVFASIRYLVFVIFTVLLVLKANSEKPIEVDPRIKR